MKTTFRALRSIVLALLIDLGVTEYWIWYVSVCIEVWLSGGCHDKDVGPGSSVEGRYTPRRTRLALKVPLT